MIATAIILLLWVSDCAGPQQTTIEIKTTDTLPPIIKHDTLKIPDIRIKQVPVIVVAWRDSGSIRIDSNGLDSLRRLLHGLSFTASTDTTVVTTITTKFAVWNDTLKLNSLYLFPANTTSFVIKRNDFNYEHLIQTIINNTTSTTHTEPTFWSNLQWSIYGAATALVVREVIK